ncbi:MAG TPA: hypothetical protein VE865_08060 [Bradyrhizobium sp.]|nr:hypothetical protein [Bradyrhizobium sp.]
MSETLHHRFPGAMQQAALRRLMLRRTGIVPGAVFRAIPVLRSGIRMPQRARETVPE